MRLLCISDIHGRPNALSAVLATAERRGYHHVLVAGDLCFPGPEPLEVWRTLARIHAICVQGVTDRALATVDAEMLAQAAHGEASVARAKLFLEARAAVGELVLERLKRLPTHHRMNLEDGSELLLVHGSPEDPTEPITHDLDDDEILALIGDDPADLIVCGMSHVAFTRVVQQGERAITIVNVGSVGEAPDGTPDGSVGRLVAHATFIDTSPAGFLADQVLVPLGETT